MKTEDFERLKKLCDQNGFELVTESPNQNDKFFVVKLKNIWDGVEFAECVLKSESYTAGKIYKIDPFFLPTSIKTYQDDFGRENGQSAIYFKPSTEEAYVEQLKREAFERYGEIRGGDRFQLPSGNIYKVNFNADYSYGKSNDFFRIGGIAIYQQGKWAKKLDQPIKVTVSDFSHFGTSVQFKLLLSKWCEKSGTEIGDYLAKCLEDYLNGDAK